MLCGASECWGCRRQLSVASGLQVVGVPCNAVVEMGRRIRRAGKRRQTPGGQTGRGVGGRAQMQTRRRVGSGRRSERKGRFPQVKIIENEGATTRTGTRSRSVWSGNTKDACQEIESGDPRIVKLAAHREPCSKGGGLAPQGPVVRGSGLLFFVGSILAAGQANRPMQHLCRILLQWIYMQLRGYQSPAVQHERRTILRDRK